jgi:hypothetical protein
LRAPLRCGVAGMMDQERYARVKEVFLRALEHRQEAQRRFLDEACGADPEVRREVESLLRYHVGGPEDATPDGEAPKGGRPEPGGHGRG